MKELTPQADGSVKSRNPNITNGILDLLIEQGIYPSQLEEPLFFRRLTAGKPHLHTTVGELDGADLTGKSVYAFFPNWEDSEWVHADSALTVVQEDGGHYRFFYSEEVDVCRKGECLHDAEDECHHVDVMTLIFYSYDKALVIWES